MMMMTTSSLKVVLSDQCAGLSGSGAFRSRPRITKASSAIVKKPLGLVLQARDTGELAYLESVVYWSPLSGWRQANAPEAVRRGGGSRHPLQECTESRSHGSRCVAFDEAAACGNVRRVGKFRTGF
ncbi:hypothetical protein EYF80_064185 [Liparis tanakae]|uniref:Uncharacterized protein n=1 Tax=Liparis tanakae TaxID=230148 RepID=A0A4Z2EAV9_9TELE|nr:hypothetical protein EYF80_064185 [Liparis tanakae]